MLTAGLLDQYGYNAVTVATGAEALEQLDTGSSDVLLLDMNLPDGSADQVIAQMKQRGLKTPVILTSGYAEEDVDPKLLADQLVSSYLAKPYSVDRLVQAIRDATGGQEPAPGSQ
jgi:CheY-like chemotaxis protein